MNGEAGLPRAILSVLSGEGQEIIKCLSIK